LDRNRHEFFLTVRGEWAEQFCPPILPTSFRPPTASLQKIKPISG
jgi:hypothetical protein